MTCLQIDTFGPRPSNGLHEPSSHRMCKVCTKKSAKFHRPLLCDYKNDLNRQILISSWGLLWLNGKKKVNKLSFDAASKCNLKSRSGQLGACFVGGLLFSSASCHTLQYSTWYIHDTTVCTAHLIIGQLAVHSSCTVALCVLHCAVCLIAVTTGIITKASASSVHWWRCEGSTTDLG